MQPSLGLGSLRAFRPRLGAAPPVAARAPEDSTPAFNALAMSQPRLLRVHVYIDASYKYIYIYIYIYIDKRWRGSQGLGAPRDFLGTRDSL